LLIAVFLLSGCSTVKVPNIDFLKLPEFRKEANNIKNYPKVSDAPAAPDDVRSAKAWDKDAKSLIRMRDSFEAPVSGSEGVSDSEIESELARLQSKVQAYKLDDPQ